MHVADASFHWRFPSNDPPVINSPRVHQFNSHPPSSLSLTLLRETHTAPSFDAAANAYRFAASYSRAAPLALSMQNRGLGRGRGQTTCKSRPKILKNPYEP